MRGDNLANENETEAEFMLEDEGEEEKMMWMRNGWELSLSGPEGLTASLVFGLTRTSRTSNSSTFSGSKTLVFQTYYKQVVNNFEVMVWKT